MQCQSSFIEGARAVLKSVQLVEQAKDFFEGVIAEAAYASNKHRSWPNNDAIHASAILVEEAGKLTQACIDYSYRHLPPEETSARMEEKAIRVAAMALRFYASLQEYKQLKA